MAHEQLKPEKRASPADPRYALIASCLIQMGVGIGQEPSNERIALYCRALRDLSIESLKYAFDVRLRMLGHFLPSIDELRKAAEEWESSDHIPDARHLLERGDKPPGWEPMTKEESAAFIAELKRQESHARP